MATVLLGWELGGGFGHVVPLVHLARELAAHGHRPVLALKNLVATWPVWRETGFSVVPAPFFPDRPFPPGGFVARRFTDILGLRGYTTVDELAPVVTAWDRLIERVQPSLIVCDFSPTLQLAAWGAVPVVAFGNGFSLPPREGDDYPLLAPHARETSSTGQVLKVVQQVQKRRGRPVPERITNLGPADRFLTCFAPLDPYQGIPRPEPYLGPLDPLPAPTPLPDRPSFFAYLAAGYVGVELGLAALVQAGLPGQAYIRGLQPEARARLERPGLEIVTKAVSLSEELPRTSLVVHHGSLGLAHLALAAGRPQLCLPRHLEQTLTADCLERLGVGVKLAGRLSPRSVTEAAHLLLGNPRFANRAREVADQIAAAGPWCPSETIVAHCLRRLVV